MKSRNKASVVFNTADSSLELGLLFFPLLFVMFLGFPLESAQKINHICTLIATKVINDPLWRKSKSDQDLGEGEY